MTQILLGIIALLAIASLIFLWLRFGNDRAAEKLWQFLETPPATKTFTSEAIADLPEPVQRYFFHAIQPGTPLASAVQIKMNGSFKLAQRWLPMQAEEMITTAGFLWRATIGRGLVQFFVSDRYTSQVGQVYVTLWGAIPLVNQQNTNITRASIGRLAIEHIWLPSALLPQCGVQWQAIDENTIVASFNLDAEIITLTLEIDDNGRLLKVMMPRWGEDKTDKGKFAYLPYGAVFSAEATFDGYTIPSQTGVGWWFGTDRYEETFQATVNLAHYC